MVTLSKNQLCDLAVPALNRLVKECKSLEQLHLTQNRLTEARANKLLVHAHKAKLESAENNLGFLGNLTSEEEPSGIAHGVG